MSLLTEISAAAELQEVLNKLSSADANLSIRGALAEAKRQGGVDKEADRVLAEIEADTPDGKLLKGAFTRLSMCVRNFSRTSVLRPERMGSYIDTATEALARLQVSRASLMLAVIRVLTANEKDLWGTQDSPTAHAAEIAKAKEQLEAAYRKIEAVIVLGDLTIHTDLASQDRENGMSRITVRVTGDQLHLGDGRDIGERLVGWWLPNDGKKRVAA